MSDYAINLLKAIEDGEESAMGTAFRDAISAKIVDAIDAKKIEVARSVYGYGHDQVDDVTSETEISDGEVDINTTETSDENGTEEV